MQRNVLEIEINSETLREELELCVIAAEHTSDQNVQRAAARARAELAKRERQEWADRFNAESKERVKAQRFQEAQITKQIEAQEKLMAQQIDFDAINRAALASLPSLLARWLPDGVTRGAEYIARNPTRADKRPGSFKVNLRTGRWADFATGEKGGDVVSLAAYLDGSRQIEAARSLSRMLGLGHE